MNGFFRLLITSFAFAFAVSCAPKQPEEKLVTTDSVACSANRVEGRYLVQWTNGDISSEIAESDSALIEDLIRPNNAQIVLAEPDYLIQPAEFFPTTAERLSETPSDIQPNWGVENIVANSAWGKGFKGQGIVVAVVDSGVDTDHPQLATRLAVNRAELNGEPGEDDDGNGLVDDISGFNFVTNSGVQNDEKGHGTHVAGIVLADHATGAVLGVAPEARLLPIDFMDSRGGLTSNAIRGLEYAAAQGAKIVNASWGGSLCSQSLQKTFQKLEAQEILLVVAAGNSGRDLRYAPEFPAVFRGINQITVAALDPSGVRAAFSNYGSPVDLLAPGAHIFSALPTKLVPSGYGYNSGTSMAAPMVSGAAALLMSKSPNVSVSEIRRALLDSLDLFPYEILPRGKLRVDKALDQL